MKKILIILVGILILASCSRVSGTYESEKISLVDQVEFVNYQPNIVLTTDTFLLKLGKALI